jgi:hypothetical protein
MSDDFPAFGRPMMASASGGRSVASSAPSPPGSAAGKASSMTANNSENTAPVRGADRHDRLEPETREISLQRFVFLVIDLVDYKHDRLA